MPCLLFLVIYLTPTVVYLSVRRLQRNSKILLLLRKFDTSSEEALLVRDIVVQSCSRSEVPVTLQDAGLLGDFTKVFFPFSCATLIGIGLVGTAGGLVALFSSPPYTEIVFNLASFLLFMLLVRYGASPAVRFLRWVGAYQLTNPHHALKKASRILWWLQKPPFLGSGMTVLRSSEKSWRKLVRFLVRRAECVVIDLTISSESLLWEMTAALRILGPHKIVILYQEADSSGPRSEIESRLAAHFGTDLIGGFNWFGYPAQPPMLARSKMLVRSATISRSRIKKKARELRSIIMPCIQAPPEPVIGRNWLQGKSSEGGGGSKAASDGELEVLCGRCGFKFRSQPTLTFLGFQRLQCPHCSQKLRLPLAPGFRLMYGGIFGLLAGDYMNVHSKIFRLALGLAALGISLILVCDIIIRGLSMLRLRQLTKKAPLGADSAGPDIKPPRR
jgi:hypothetical protein